MYVFVENETISIVFLIEKIVGNMKAATMSLFWFNDVVPIKRVNLSLDECDLLN